MKEEKNQKAYLVGGGIASLSAAFFLLEDTEFKGRDIVIMENTAKFGGSLDGSRSKTEEGAYIMRGHRILDSKTFECTFAMLDRLASPNFANTSITEEIIEFNRQHITRTKARLIDHGEVVDAYKLGLNNRDRLKLSLLLFCPETFLDNKKVNDYFSTHFFTTNFWYEFATTFAMQPWHSLIEFKRYILRSFHALQYYDTMECIIVPPYCYFDSIVSPLIKYLKEHDVNFLHDTRVLDLHFENDNKQDYVSEIVYEDIAGKKNIKLQKDDIVIATLGSMTSNSSIGSSDRPAILNNNGGAASWDFWERLSARRHDVGNPQVFDSEVNKSKWLSFTVTTKDPLFFDLMEKITDSPTGSSGGTTLKNSPWFFSIGLPHQPHFKDQASDTYVAWGYGLSPDNIGEHIKKKMSDCSGYEILEELCFHLGILDKFPEIKKEAHVVPCMMPYITSQFAVRQKKDRPRVASKYIKNLAFIGQFVEIKNDITFTVELSVRSAQTAVYSLCRVDKKVPKVYKGYMNLSNIIELIKVLFR